MKFVRLLFLSVLAFALCCVARPAEAQTYYAYQLAAVFGPQYTGGTVTISSVTDAGGTSRTSAFSGVTFTESPTGSGNYIANVTAASAVLLNSWTYPLYATYTITVNGATAYAAQTNILSDRAAQVTDGYTPTLASNIGTSNTTVAKFTFDGHTVPYTDSDYWGGAPVTGMPLPTGTAVTLPTTVPSTFLSTDTTLSALPVTINSAAVYPVVAAQTTTGTAETLTEKQVKLLNLSVLLGNHTASLVNAGTQTVTYYLFGYTAIQANIVETVTVNTTSGQVVARLIAQPFPSGT